MKPVIAWKAFCLCASACACLAFAGDEDLKRLPDGAGKDTVVRVCTACHGPRNFTKMRLGREDWEDQAADMVERGAKVTPEELAALVNYLTANFGLDAKVNVNQAPIDELKNALGLSVTGAKAVVQYRQDHGNFKEWRDLLKVPGVDAKKIEEKAERMTF